MNAKASKSFVLTNVKAKTTLVCALICIGLTLFKFGLYWLSGSLAVLSEAWHSLTDIVTTMLVFVAVWRAERNKSGKAEAPEPAEESDAKPEERDTRFKRILRELVSVHPELKMAFVIALVLLALSISIMVKVSRAEAREISLPLVTGVIFVIFSFGSYFLHRFKTAVGEKEKSAALVADGLHSKSDMVVALLTGFSLILYRFGLNIDRLVGGAIALIILSFSVEMLVNVVIAHLRRSEEYTVTHKTHEIVRYLFSKEIYRAAGRRLDSVLRGRLRQLRRSKAWAWFWRVAKWTPALVVVALALGYLSTCLYSVQVNEEAIVERFGRPVNKETPVQTGLHVKFPWPIDKVCRVDTYAIRQVNIGNVAGTDTALLWTRKHGDEMHFLSGDNNLLNPYVVIHYRIKTPADYLFRQVQAEELLGHVSNRVLTEMYAKQTFYDLAIFHRKEWMVKAESDIQDEIDSLRSGLEIVDLFLKDFHPPRKIAGRFEEVIAAYQIKQKLINRAIGYKYTQLPAARANAYKTRAKAEAYVVDKTNRAEGDCERFLLRASQYKRPAVIMRRILYLNAMKKALQNNAKIIVDPECGLSDVWLTGGQLGAGSGLNAD